MFETKIKVKTCNTYFETKKKSIMEDQRKKLACQHERTIQLDCFVSGRRLVSLTVAMAQGI